MVDTRVYAATFSAAAALTAIWILGLAAALKVILDQAQRLPLGPRLYLGTALMVIGPSISILANGFNTAKWFLTPLGTGLAVGGFLLVTSARRETAASREPSVDPVERADEDPTP